ncbi:MAG: YbaN family protein [Alistipes sp.]|nr:YbaN family protein [Alistipes sp.]
MKILGIAAGSLALTLGIVGIFVPLLPTTPFLLLAAALYLRSSPRLYDWLLNQKYLGTYIRNFREHRAIPLRAKIVSVGLVWLTIGYCILRVVDAWWWAQLGLLLLAAGISARILTFATSKR